MNATAVCFAVDGDTVANKAGCRWASWYLRTLSSTSFGKSPKLMDLIMYDGLDRNFLLFPRAWELHSWWIRDETCSPNVMRLATNSPKTLPLSAIFSGCWLRLTWGRKRRKKKRRKVRVATQCINRINPIAECKEESSHEVIIKPTSKRIVSY